MKYPAKIFSNLDQAEHNDKLLDKLDALLAVKYGRESFSFTNSKVGLYKSAAYWFTGRYSYTVFYSNKKTGDEVCLMFPIKEWTSDFFECLEDKIIRALDFSIKQAKEEK